MKNKELAQGQPPENVMKRMYVLFHAVFVGSDLQSEPA